MNFPSLKFAIPVYFVYIVIAACLLPVILNVAGIDFGKIPIQPKIFINNTLEVACLCTALLTVFLSFVDFRIKGDVSTPIVAFVLLCSAGFDLLHILASNSLILTSHHLTFITIYTWVFSRTFNALILLIGAGLFLKQSDNLFKNVNKHNLKFLFYVLSFLVLITCCIILFVLNLSFQSEKTLFAATISRNLDIIPLLLYIFSLTIIFPKFYTNHPSIFSQTLLVSLIPSIAAQLHVIFGSRMTGDNHFIIAGYDKLISYMVPFVGISLNYLQTHQNERRVIRALVNESDEKKDLSNYLKGILNASMNGILVFESIRNSRNEISEFRCIMNNAAAEELLLIDKTGPFFSDIFRDKNELLLSKFKDLVEKDKRLNFEMRHESLNKWFLISAVKMKDGFTQSIFDITENKKVQEEIIKREALLAASEKIAQLGSWERDLVTGKVVWSDNLYRLFGFEKERFNGTIHETAKYLHPDDREYVAGLIEEAIRNKRPFEYEYRRITPKNEVKHFVVKGTFILDDHNTPQKMVGVNMDISAVKKSDELLKKSEQLYKTIAANMPDTEVLLFNREGEIMLAEGNSRTPLFRTKDKMHDKNIREMLAAFGLEYLLNEPGRQEVIEADNQFFKVQHIEVFNESNEPFAGMILAQDVTAIRMAQDDLEQKISDLNKSNKELEQFAYVASHDLQEPLRKITSFGDRLKLKFGNQLPAEAAEYVNRMFDASMRMQNLISDLLLFSRLTRSTEPFNPVSLDAVLKNILNDIEMKIQQRGAKINISPLPVIDAVETQMQQLFQNLILNSLKFQKPGNRTEIEITSEIKSGFELNLKNSRRKYCKIMISDNGIGFEQKESERIFALFQRLHGRSEFEGTGIGLSVCKKIIENHHGMIYATSEEGKGSVFTVIIPVKQKDK
jgi:PAS domain S-box-containing protein